MFPLDDFLESPHGFAEGDILAFASRKRSRHEEWLREEELDLPGARDHQFVFFRELVNSQDGNDVLQILVLLQNLLHGASCVVVLVTNDARIKNAGGGSQWIDCRIDTHLR